MSKSDRIWGIIALVSFAIGGVGNAIQGDWDAVIWVVIAFIWYLLWVSAEREAARLRRNNGISTNGL
jgi:hypothetical protein